MRIVIAHVRYRYRGGEDAVVDTEATLLRDAGHEVFVLEPRSAVFDSMPLATKLEIGLCAGDHRYGRCLVRRAIRAYHPDVVHFHNLYPLLGSGAIAEAASLGCATVQTLHNYRLSCVAGTHSRDGVVCEECSPGRSAHGVRHACYRSSVLQSAAMARGIGRQWQLACVERTPQVVLCLTEFMRKRLLDAGAPGDALFVKPNGVRGSSGLVPWESRSGAVFVGRLSAEKGILPLIEGWGDGCPHLTVVGEGPLEAEVSRVAESRTAVSYIGALNQNEVRARISQSRVLVLPSIWYEGLPLVLVEALAEGTPVVGFARGACLSLHDIADDLLATPEDFNELRHTASKLADADEAAWTALSESCVRVHRERYDLSTSLNGLERAYATAIARVGGGR